jgi:uncharacterized protein DUF6081
MSDAASKAAKSRDSQAAPFHTVWDRFDSGFSIGAPDARWFYFESGPFSGNDGIATVSPEGLRVIPKGKNPTTGEPAFTNTLPQEKDASGVPGQFDHVKWLVYANHKASTGIPGFDAVRGQELAFETWISGRTYGTQAHPFGSAVRDPEDDLRLANFAQNAIDFETGVVFDFMFTNKRVYALYERLSYARTPQNHYAAFTYTIPVAERTPSTVHHVKIAYDREAQVVRWLIDETEVFRVKGIGRRIDSKWLRSDHGGKEEELDLRQVSCGMGLFTLLDSAQDGRALVRLSGKADYYPHSQGKSASVPFVDEESRPGSRLFGQGAEVRVLRYAVSSTPLPR